MTTIFEYTYRIDTIIVPIFNIIPRASVVIVDTYSYVKKILESRGWVFTAAYHSLEQNVSYLFTYQKYPELNIPNTTVSLDGSFSALKKKLGIHQGLRRDRRYKVISDLFDGRT